MIAFLPFHDFTDAGICSSPVGGFAFGSDVGSKGGGERIRRQLIKTELQVAVFDRRRHVVAAGVAGFGRRRGFWRPRHERQDQRRKGKGRGASATISWDGILGGTHAAASKELPIPRRPRLHDTGAIVSATGVR